MARKRREELAALTGEGPFGAAEARGGESDGGAAWNDRPEGKQGHQGKAQMQPRLGEVIEGPRERMRKKLAAHELSLDAHAGTNVPMNGGSPPNR